MDIETTPKSGLIDEDSRLSSLGRRHTPTVRMSERKRNLFHKRQTDLGLILDDDVDLGPMSPLQYSSSPTDDTAHHKLPFDRNTRQTDFSNIFPGSLKPASCLSPISSINSPLLAPSEHPVLVMEESASSTIISVQSAGGGVAAANPLKSTEKYQPRIVQERTPSERMINCQDLRVSFKKSLILGDIVTPTSSADDDQQRVAKNQKRSYSTSVLSEKNVAAVAGQQMSPKEKIAKLEATTVAAIDPKARTSLTFDAVSISTKKFYSSTNDENREPPFSRKRYSLPLMPRETTKGRSSLGGGTSSAKRTSKGLGVAKKGCSHNIKKPVRVASKETLKKKVELAVLEDQREREKEQEKALVVEDPQTTRINEIMKNIKNPLEMSRPLFFTEPKTGDDRFTVSDEEPEEAQEEEERSKRKFFKSGSKQAKSYKLTANVVATVEGGKITLPKFPAQTGLGSLSHTHTASFSTLDKSDTDGGAGDFSMIDEEFGNEEFDEVTGIITKLTKEDAMDEYRNRLPYNTTDPAVIAQQTEDLELLIRHEVCTEDNFKYFIAERATHQREREEILKIIEKESQQATTPKATTEIRKPSPTPAPQQGLFPIFYQNRQQQQQSNKKKVVAMGADGGSSRKVWKRIGDAQLQIDAGQKRFGATYCAECDLLYSVHEPEDELMHQRFHTALSVLKFSGWKQESVVQQVPRWGVTGRVIAVAWNEHRAKILRVNSVLEVMNREMGCPAIEWRSKTIVYLAVAQNTILGVCVAEAKYEANRLVTETGVDYFSEEVYPVWCGIARIWVAAPYRNQGVATELLNAVRGHFTIGRTLAVGEIAFQSPTEAGKLLAQKTAQRKDFLVYP